MIASLALPPEITSSQLYAKGGFTLVERLFSEEDLRELQTEALTARSAAFRNELAASSEIEEQERGGSPARAFSSAPGGAVQLRLFRASVVLGWLEQISGASVVPTGGGSFTYYERAGDFLSLHRDIATCDLALITCLEETASSETAGGLLVYPEYMLEPLSSVHAAGRASATPVPLRCGETIALFGGLVPHEVAGMDPRQERIVSLMCYRILPAGGSAGAPHR